MTYTTTKKPRDPRYGRRGAAGSGTLIATIIFVALIVLGAFYWTRDKGAPSTADNAAAPANIKSGPSAAAAPAKK